MKNYITKKFFLCTKNRLKIRAEWMAWYLLCSDNDKKMTDHSFTNKALVL